MSKVFLLLLGIIISVVTPSLQAQIHDDILGALEDSQVKPKSKKVKVFKKNELITGKSMEKTSCNMTDQRSLPLSFVMKLLRSKGATLTPTHNASTGKLNVFGGPMIANCNSMLDYVLHPAKNGMPHSFEVVVKSPTGCLSGKCDYSVKVIEEDKINIKKMKFEPTMSGFIQCLKESGVFAGGSVNKGKIFQADFNAEEEGITSTGDLVFVSQGPKTGMMSKVFSEKNLYPNDECYYYENIQKDNIRLFSKSDLSKQSLMSEASALCSGADYKEIYENLNSFASISGTYQQLEGIMKKDLLEKIKAAKKEFDKAVEKGDLSKLDTKKYAELFDAFQKMIIEKHLDSSAHNEADKANPELLINLERKLAAAGSDEEKAQIEKKMRDIAAKLAGYAKEPYFTKEDFSKFLSLQRKAPLKDPLWKKASLKMHKSIVSINGVCQAYATDNSSCKNSSDIEDLMEVEDLNDVIAGMSDKAKTAYNKREQVLKSPDEDKSEFFAEKVRECKKLFAKRKQGANIWRQIAPRASQNVRSQCMRKNPYAAQYRGRYLKKYQSCVESEMSALKAKYVVNETKIELCNENISQYQKKYSEWATLEKYRDDYYAGKKKAKTKKKTPSILADQKIQFPPYQPPYQTPRIPQFNPLMNPNMMNRNMYSGQYPQMNPNNYGFNQSYTSGFNSGFNNGFNNNYNPYASNGGLNFNLRAGINNYYSMQNRYPSLATPGFNGVYQQNFQQNFQQPYQQFSPAMNGFMYNQTSPVSGSYNFLNLR